MSRLEELIQQYCPDGVEYKSFFDVCDFVRGITYNKQQEARTEVDAHKVLRANNITLHLNALNFDDVKFVVNDVKVKPSQFLYRGDILMCAGSGSKEHIGKVAYISEDMDYTFGGFMSVVRCKDILLPRFMFHILTDDLFTQHLEREIKSSTINNINNQVMQSLFIPVPPLPVQEEIVRILDTFIELQAELQAELQKRKQQYNYYRDNLLSFEGRTDVEWKKLGELGRISSGKNKQKKKEGAYPVYGSTGIIAFCDEFKYDKPLILVARVGANAGYTHIASGQYDVSDNTLIVDLEKKSVIQKYIFYILVNINLNRYAKGGGQPLITAGEIKEITIPIPPLAEQQRIVDILDRFDALTNDITAGLPAEIEARRKQYEYYRDKLLTFKQKV